MDFKTYLCLLLVVIATMHVQGAPAPRGNAVDAARAADPDINGGVGLINVTRDLNIFGGGNTISCGSQGSFGKSGSGGGNTVNVGLYPGGGTISGSGGNNTVHVGSNYAGGKNTVNGGSHYVDGKNTVNVGSYIGVDKNIDTGGKTISLLC